MRNTAHRETGFTLVEMLVALFIFALLSSAGVAMMRFSVSSQEAVREHTDRLAAFQNLRAILKADLSQAAPRRVRGPDGHPIREAFDGGRDAFLTLARRGWENPDAAPRASVQGVEYRLEDGVLTRTARDALDGGARREPQVLIDGVEAARISFLHKGQWLPNLPVGPADPLPQAVRIDLTLEAIGPVSQLFLVTGQAP